MWKRLLPIGLLHFIVINICVLQLQLQLNDQHILYANAFLPPSSLSSSSSIIPHNGKISNKNRRLGTTINNDNVVILYRKKTTTGTTSTTSSSSSTSLASHQVNLLANKKRISSTIDSLIEAQDEVRCEQYHQQQHHQYQYHYENDPSMGVLGTPTYQEQQPLSPPQNNNNSMYYNYHIPLIPKPGTILIPQKAKLTKSGWITKHRLKEHMSVRVGTAVDDTDVAHLRLSVFSDHDSSGSSSSSNNRYFDQDWIYRSSAIIRQRRLKGATCINASLNYIDESSSSGTNTNTNDVLHKDLDDDGIQSWIVGSIECSTHEFIGTELGSLRPQGSMLYISEVAVSPKIRRSGTATMLLKALDKLATVRNVETLYLHVDVNNFAAYSLYKRAGYEILDSHNNQMYAEFTRKLNLHDGATRGRNHYLMHKKVSRKQTWYTNTGRYESSNEMSSFSSSSSNGRRSGSGDDGSRRGTLGFEIWD